MEETVWLVVMGSDVVMVGTGEAVDCSMVVVMMGGQCIKLRCSIRISQIQTPSPNTKLLCFVTVETTSLYLVAMMLSYFIDKPHNYKDHCLK